MSATESDPLTSLPFSLSPPLPLSLLPLGHSVLVSGIAKVFFPRPFSIVPGIPGGRTAGPRPTFSVEN